MAWPVEEHFQQLVEYAHRVLREVRILRRDEDNPERAFIYLEGKWQDYRVMVSEIHRRDGSVRYGYYVLDKDDQQVVGFDNSSDATARRLKYGPAASTHLHEELSHQHTPDGDIRLTEMMDFEGFLAWVEKNL